MKLDDLQNPSSAAVMAQLLKKHHGIQMPVDQMTARTATTMLENVQRKLTKFRNTHASHVAERNSNYLAMLMVEQTLKAKIAENKKLKESEIPSTLTSPDMKHALKHLGNSVRRAIPGQSYYGNGSSVTMGRIYDKLSSPNSNNSSNNYSDIFSGLNLDPDDINNALQIARKDTKNINPKVSEVLYQVVNHLKKKGLVSESVQLNESSVGEAEVVLAAKDMVDRIQDMVETMGKMVNEELPALNETIRDTMSAEQADAFTASATEAINAALDHVRETKNALDAATRTLAGEQPAEPTGLSEPDMTDVEPSELEPGSEEQNLVEPEPLGRGKR